MRYDYQYKTKFPSICLFNKHLLRDCSVPGTALGTEDSKTSKK